MSQSAQSKRAGYACFWGLFLAAATWSSPCLACPFCRSAPTVSGRLESQDIPIAVVAEMLPPRGEDRLRTYRIVEVLKGNAYLADSEREFKAHGVDGAQVGQRFFATAARVGEPPTPYWDSPQREPVTSAGMDYLKQLPAAPDKGRERLEFLIPFLNDPDDFIAEDVYAEIAAASLDDIKRAKHVWPREKLLAWIKDDTISYLRRRQFLVLLSVCGEPEDAAILEQLIEKDPGGTGSVLDAAVASYLTLRGEAGLAFINESILSQADAPYAKGMETAKALRFHGDDEQLIPQEKLLPSLRLMLDRPAWADQIISDLARWEDWSVMDRLVRMFKDAGAVKDELSRHALRVAVAQYLMACPLPEAEHHLGELRTLDPKAVDQAERFLILPGGGSGATREQTLSPQEADNEAADEMRDDESIPTSELPAGGSNDPPVGSPRVAEPNSSSATAATEQKPKGPRNSALDFPILPASLVVLGLAVLFAANVAIFRAFRPQG